MIVSPEQIRAARALLRLEQADLADRAHVSVVTIRRLEAADGTAQVSSATVDGIRRALEQAGAEFISDGVRRRDARREDSTALFNDLRALSLRSAERLQGCETLNEADLYDEDGLPV